MKNETSRSGMLLCSILALGSLASCAAHDADPAGSTAGLEADETGSDLGSDNDGTFSSEDDLSTSDEADDEEADGGDPDDVPAPGPSDAQGPGGATALVGPAGGHAVGWTRPLSGYRVSQEFRGASVHNGIDLAKPYGSVVYAAHAGKVTAIIRGVCKAGYKCVGTGRNWALDRKYHMSGDKVVVTHSNGVKTIYDHTAASGLAYVGMVVRADTPVGRISRTGNRSGPHLHFAVWTNGRASNPRIYVRL